MAKILVAEDDWDLGNIYKARLAESGYTFKIVDQGDQVIKAVEDFRPDLIILDLVMPRKSGTEILEELKKNASWKSIPVIIVSNLERTEEIYLGRKLGADDYLLKVKTSMNEILARVKTLLES
jgi:DNA-binding response OmpR family regulator